MLDELAQSTAREIAAHGMTTSMAGRRIDDALSRDGRWRGGRTRVRRGVDSAAQAVESLGNALADASVTHVGRRRGAGAAQGGRQRPFRRDRAGHAPGNCS